MKVFAIYNLKGGVGKTTAAVNLAYLSARDGYRTLLWDLDPQGAASFYFRVKPDVKGGGRRLLQGKLDLETLLRGTDFAGLDLLPADFSYRHMEGLLDEGKKADRRLRKLLKPLSGAYDHVFLDCPPGFSLVSENVFVAADVLLMPVVPTTLSLRTLDQILAYFAKHPERGLLLLPFFSMVDRRKRLHRELRAARDEDEVRLLATAIPFSSEVERMGVHRAPLPSYDVRGTAGRAFAALWEEIKSQVGRSQAAGLLRS